MTDQQQLARCPSCNGWHWTTQPVHPKYAEAPCSTQCANELLRLAVYRTAAFLDRPLPAPDQRIEKE